MKKFKSELFIIVFFKLFCLSLIHAQTPALPTSNLPITNFPTVEPRPINSPVVAPTPPPLISGKYIEYQSYCRQNDFSESPILNSEQKNNRIKLLTEKLKKNSNNATVINAIIKEHASSADQKAAESVFLKNINSLSPEDIAVWTADFESQKKQYTSATSKLEKYIQENSKSTKALLKLANIKKLIPRYSEAIEIFLDLQKINKQIDYSVELCELYTLDSHHIDAEKNCQIALLRRPNNPLPEIYLGISYRERELFKESQFHFERSLQKQKTEFALTCLGELFYLKKDTKKTIHYLNLAVAQNKLSARAQLGLAIAEFEDQKYTAALENFKQACLLGQKDTLAMQKSYKILEEKKSDFAKSYFDEIQKCKGQSLF